MQIPVLLDRSRPESLTDQLVEQLRGAIRSGRLAPGVRLPSSRRLADQLAISRNTVIRAYDLLAIEGLLESRPASGVFVCDKLPGPPSVAAPSHAAARGEQPRSHMPMPPLPLRHNALLDAHRSRLAFDFAPGATNAALFPIKSWRRLLQSALSRGGAAALSHYPDPAGLPALRSAVATHIAGARGIVADPGRIVVTAGTQEGLSIAARLFLNQGTLAALEDPCHQGAVFAFEATGSNLVSVPVDFEGILPEALPQRPTALLYVTPSHQYPTGHVLSLPRREALANWARRCGCYIVEDDRNAEFCYEGSPLPAIAAGAPDCTIYLGSFSHTLGAGLRLGYMVVPEHLAGVTRSAKALVNSGHPWLEQTALAEMMRSHAYVAHVQRLRAQYRESRDCLLDALRRNFGDVSVTGHGGGLHVMWYLPPGVPDAPVVEDLARRARIGVYSLNAGGASAAAQPALAQRGLILGHGGLSRKQIVQGIARLSDAIDDAVDDHKVDLDKLFARTLLPTAAFCKPLRLDSKVRRRPALPTMRRRVASSASRMPGRSSSAMITVSTIYHYPVKGLSGQPLAKVSLNANKPFPHDRIYALARPGTPIDPEHPQWAKKGLFAMLMLDEGLATVRTQLDPETHLLTVMQGNQQVATARLDDPAERESVERYFWKLLPNFPAPPIIVRSRGGHFMDKPDNVISMINLATVRQLEQLWGYEIDPLRFRANIYIDGAEPWEEFNWVGGDIRIGDTVLCVDRKNGRCGATNVNPANGRRDLDIPGSLRNAFGHKNLGIYLTVREGGQVAVGDALETPRGAAAPVAGNRPATAALAAPTRSFICRGCYFIYEEAKGLPAQAIAPNTPFADIPADWRCPDCGTEKSTFRPHVEHRRVANPVTP